MTDRQAVATDERPSTSTDLTDIVTVKCSMSIEEHEKDETLLEYMQHVHSMVESRLQFLLEFSRIIIYS